MDGHRRRGPRGRSGGPGPAGAGPRPLEPRAWWPRAVPVIVTGLVLNALVALDQVRETRSRQQAVDLVIIETRPAARTAPASRSGAVQDAVVEVGVRNAGSYALHLLDQQLDGGGPVDRGPTAALAADATAVLAVRWRVLCAEVGSVFAPRALVLTVRPRRGGERSVSLGLTLPARQLFRTAASRACAP